MELEVEIALKKKYQKLILHQMETGRIIESMNSLLPETENFNIMTGNLEIKNKKSLCHYIKRRFYEWL